MNKFALAVIDQVKGRIRFCRLFINEECQFDEFCREISAAGNLEKELDTIFSRMNCIANMERLPKEKFRDITPQKEIVKEFEIKTKNLRVYMIKEEGHIVVLGGKKNAQERDIRKFRSIKEQYLNAKSNS